MVLLEVLLGPLVLAVFVIMIKVKLLFFFSKAIGVLWAYEAEVKTILSALQFCKQFGLSHVLIENNSTLSIGWVNCRVNRPVSLLNDLNLIDVLMKDIDCIAVFHSF